MSEPFDGMVSWVGSLGARESSPDTPGYHLATRIIGKDGVDALHAYFSDQSVEVVSRARIAAIHACIWIAQADREIADEETELLEQVITQSGLVWAEQMRLVGAMRAPLDVDAIVADLTDPYLRELILSVGWALALVDGNLDDSEGAALETLRAALSIDEERADAIRSAVYPDE